MLRKRVIFVLLYENGMFNLSRNFRLQRVGDSRWLQKNYNFAKVSHAIDELIILDVTRGTSDFIGFCQVINEIAKNCFVPISVGGKVNSIYMARELLRSGADKIILNSCLITSPELVEELAVEFGQQCLVASLDVMGSKNKGFQIYIQNGSKLVDQSAEEVVTKVLSMSVGELYLNSMDRDGTGQGFEMDLLELLPADIQIPIILAGGAGNSNHLLEAVSNARVDAVATANLFNFVGDGLERAREELRTGGISLPIWETEFYEQFGKEVD